MNNNYWKHRLHIMTDEKLCELSDDLHRAILKIGNLNDPVANMAQSCMQDIDIERASRINLREIFQAIDIIPPEAR